MEFSVEDLHLEQNVAEVGVRAWNPSTLKTHILSPISDYDRNSEHRHHQHPSPFM